MRQRIRWSRFLSTDSWIMFGGHWLLDHDHKGFQFEVYLKLLFLLQLYCSIHKSLTTSYENSTLKKLPYIIKYTKAPWSPPYYILFNFHKKFSFSSLIIKMIETWWKIIFRHEFFCLDFHTHDKSGRKRRWKFVLVSKLANFQCKKVKRFWAH